MVRRVTAFLLLLPALTACADAPEAERSSAARIIRPTTALTVPEFARLIESLSEPGGYFPSDNLVSNETSYLHVLPTLDELETRGGAYLGVGPDQNFSYIAHVRPSIAFIIDIRRDNLLHHLLFKALFENARNRFEYLSLMLGKPIPDDLEAWDDATIDEIVLQLDSTWSTDASFEDAHDRLAASIARYGYRLSNADRDKISLIHSMFYFDGLDIRYSNRARGRYGRFPTWRNLMLQTDLEGQRRSYLASESAFRFVKDLQRRNLVVPVVGDLAGPHALSAIGREVGDRGLTITVFYTSNVEQYLMRGPEFEMFAATVADLPVDERSVIIRSYFPRGWPVAQTLPGHFSTQLVERFATFIGAYHAGGYRSYQDLVTLNVLPLPVPADSLRVAS